MAYLWPRGIVWYDATPLLVKNRLRSPKLKCSRVKCLGRSYYFHFLHILHTFAYTALMFARRPAASFLLYAFGDLSFDFAWWWHFTVTQVPEESIIHELAFARDRRLIRPLRPPHTQRCFNGGAPFISPAAPRMAGYAMQTAFRTLCADSACALTIDAGQTPQSWYFAT